MKRESDADVRFRLLLLLALEPQVSQRRLSASLGISLGRVNLCLRAMVAGGLLAVEARPTVQNSVWHAYTVTTLGYEEAKRLKRRVLVDRRKHLECLALELARFEELAKRVRP
jgi:predicted transcriptional regulator